jgi:hypothetical protein
MSFAAVDVREFLQTDDGRRIVRAALADLPLPEPADD